MKVVLKIIEREYDISHEIEIDGLEDRRIHSLCDCPEDAIIGRDLVDGHDIVGYMEMAYEAGKKGEELGIEIIDVKE